MPPDYSLRDAQKMLGTDNKMLQKWIAEALRTGESVRPHVDPRNQSRKLLTRRQVERLAELHGRTLLPDIPTPDPLAALESRLRAYVKQEIAAQIAALEQRLLEARPAAPVPPPVQHAPVTHPTPQQTALPARQTLFPLDPISTEDKPFKNRPGAMIWMDHHLPRAARGKRWLDIPTASHRAVLEYARQKGQPFTSCDDPGCLCRVLLKD